MTQARLAVMERLVEKARLDPLVLTEVSCGCPSIGTPHLPHYKPLWKGSALWPQITAFRQFNGWAPDQSKEVYVKLLPGIWCEVVDGIAVRRLGEVRENIAA